MVITLCDVFCKVLQLTTWLQFTWDYRLPVKSKLFFSLYTSNIFEVEDNSIYRDATCNTTLYYTKNDIDIDIDIDCTRNDNDIEWVEWGPTLS